MASTILHKMANKHRLSLGEKEESSKFYRNEEFFESEL